MWIVTSTPAANLSDHRLSIWAYSRYSYVWNACCANGRLYIWLRIISCSGISYWPATNHEIPRYA